MVKQSNARRGDLSNCYVCQVLPQFVRSPDIVGPCVRAFLVIEHKYNFLRYVEEFEGVVIHPGAAQN